MTDEDWSGRCFGMLMDGRARMTALPEHGREITLLIVFNGHYDLVDFTLPACRGGVRWQRVVDTNLPDAGEEALFEIGDVYGVTGRSLLLFALQRT